MEEPCDVPELLNIFTKIVCDGKHYCYMCLRTNDERKLVKPEALQNFLAATKLNTNGSAQYVCFVCERQASNALKVFRAAIFASSLGLILAELRSRTIPSNKIMMETKYFKRILNKVQLSQHLTPQAIDKEVQLIRENNRLSETDTLVMDNQQIYESGGTPAPPPPPPPTLPLPLPLPTLPLAPPRCATPSILPDREVTQEELRHHNLIAPQESYVILDEEDDPLRPTNVPNPPQNTMTPASNLNQNLVITTNPPNIVKFQDLFAQNAQNHTNFLLHPIFLDDGKLTVPSLSAVIINNRLLFHDNAKNIQHSLSLNVNLDVVKQNLSLNREVFLQNCNDFQLPTINSITPSVNSNLNSIFADKGCQSDFPKYPQKKMRTDVSRNIFGVKSKNSSQINNVQISDISSDMDAVSHSGKSGDSKTDWEDKIPMDVISFVDAVDPNADAAFSEPLGNPSNNFHVGDVRSLANEQSQAADIIDLC